ncbi:hypothetical protein RIF29_03812 [Crotalaria pallida]|uniref:Uncharacterized protein n=1 Tax=Crotalaria pallida TaxID=3830 RepID=A0AAN9J0C2_CROPI
MSGRSPTHNTHPVLFPCSHCDHQIIDKSKQIRTRNTPSSYPHTVIHTYPHTAQSITLPIPKQHHSLES